MSLEHVSPGQPLRIDAGDWNKITDMARNYTPYGQGGRAAGQQGINPCIVQVKNATGGALDRGSVVELTTPLLDDLDPYHLWFNAEKVDISENRVACILLKALKTNEIGPAQMSGVCMAKVDIEDEEHRYAAIEDDETELKSGSSGQWRLLTPPTETGDQMLPVKHEPTIKESYIEYALGKAAEGFDNSDTAHPKLTWAERNGWPGCTYKCGSEEEVGVEYDDGETEPSTNGNFLITKSGLFRFVFTGWARVVGSSSPATEASGAASAGSAHTHPVKTFTGLLQGGWLQISLYVKEDEGDMERYEDELGNYRQFTQNMPSPVRGTGQVYVPLNFQFNVSLNESDRFTIKVWWADGLSNGDELQYVSYNVPTMRISRIGEPLEWEEI